jgi:hypothetical protein
MNFHSSQAARWDTHVSPEEASRFLPFENDRSWRIELVLTVDPNDNFPPNSDVFGHVVAEGRIKPP